MGKTRRHVIKGLGASLVAVTARPVAAAPLAPLAPRSLSFANLHTGEQLRVDYWREGSYLADALRQIEWTLRDFRTGASHPIDPRLLDQLHLLSNHLGTAGHFDVISGYRSPVSNAFLRASTSGVALNSFHMKGMAIDVRVPEVSLTRLRDTARSLNAGGVGYYPASDFVHVDTGPARHW